MLLLQFVTEEFQFHKLCLFLQESATPEVDAQAHCQQEGYHQPAITKQWRCYGDLQHCLILTHRAVLIQHPHMEGITAMMKRHISDIRIHLLGLA